MNIQYFKENANTLCCHELAKQLGYQSRDKFDNTFNQFIQSTSINEWLDKGHYDLVSNAKTFFVAVAQFAKFSQNEIDSKLADFASLQKEKAKFKDSFIFVNTCFTRTNEPIFALAACESIRRLKLYNEQNLLSQSRTELLSELSKIIVEHYNQNQGMLGIWGKIHDYHVHLQDEVLVLNKQG